MMMGRVFLVGAGPGDPGLVTVKAKMALEQADIVLYDYLVHPTILTYANFYAKLICVGKRRGFHLKQQGQINQLMRRFSQKGKGVVRLKGGDPMVFGRGGEEMEFLSKYRIPYEVIPGVSSSIAAPTFAGIPVTHRLLSRSVTLITGTSKKGEKISDLMIPDSDTIIFLMPISHMRELVRQIIDTTSLRAKTPAALIYRATTSEQKVILGTLGTIADLHMKNQITSPSIFIVGEVVRLSPRLQWFSALPLAGKRVIVLRTLKQSGDLFDRLLMLGADVVKFPIIQTVPAIRQLNRIKDKFLDLFSMIIFTSPNGVDYFFKGLLENQGDCRDLFGKTIVALGPKTAAHLKNFGINPDIVPDVFVQEGILKSLPHDLKGQKILIPTSDGARSDLEKGLRKRGSNVTVLNLYKTVCPKNRDVVEIKDGDAVIFTSSSTASHFFKHNAYKKQNIVPFCIGEITAHQVKKYWKKKIFVAEKATLDSLVAAVLENKGTSL